MILMMSHERVANWRSKKGSSRVRIDISAASLKAALVDPTTQSREMTLCQRDVKGKRKEGMKLSRRLI